MKTKNLSSINKLDFLISFYIFCIVVAEIMGGKTFPIINNSFLKLNASIGIFLIPIIYSINDIITEVYGAQRTRSIIRISMIILVFLSLFIILATSLPPSYRFIKTEPSYDLIFRQSARITIASLIAFTLSDFLDVLIFVKIRERLGKKALWFRTNFSNIISMFIDTVIFLTLAFYTLDKSLSSNVIFLTSLILPYWLLKCFMSVIETPLVYIGVKWLKHENKQS